MRDRLDAARMGDQAAWTELYRELAPLVLGYLRARRAPEPEDLAGEVFAQMARDLASFDGGERELRAWVLRIAHNRLIDLRRHRARRPLDLPGGELAEQRAGPSAEGEALERLGGEEVRRLLGLLTADQEAVLLLRVIGGLNAREIAKVLGKRQGAVKALQRRGLERIRRELERDG